MGLLIENASIEQLGLARKVTITKDSTTLIADAASKDELQARVAQLKKELAETDSVYDSEKLAERIAKLSGGVAVIKVGAATEHELENRKLRIEDAKNATFAAIEEGIVPGGGTALVHLSAFVPAIKDKLEDADQFGTGGQGTRAYVYWLRQRDGKVSECPKQSSTQLTSTETCSEKSFNSP